MLSTWQYANDMENKFINEFALLLKAFTQTYMEIMRQTDKRKLRAN